MASRFVPVLTDLPDLASPSTRGARKNAAHKPARKPARKNPIGKTKRGKRGGWVSKSGKGKFEHLRVRPPGHFVAGSLKTVPWAFISDVRERAFVLKKRGLKTVPAGAKAITGHIKSTVTSGRVKGTKVKWLATGVQALLVPLKRARVNPPLTSSEERALLRQYAALMEEGRGSKDPRVSEALFLRSEAISNLLRERGSSESMRVVERIDMSHRKYGKFIRPRRHLSAKIATPERMEAGEGLYALRRHPAYRPNAPRKNPGRLIILNPADASDPITKTAKAMSPAARAALERVVHGASAAEIAALRKGLVTYHGFHGVWPPSIEKHGSVPGKQTRFLVGLGKADHVGYRVNKKYPGSNKNGAPFRHHFSSGQELVTNEEGKGLTVLDRRGARHGTEVTDWIRG